MQAMSGSVDDPSYLVDMAHAGLPDRDPARDRNPARYRSAPHQAGWALRPCTHSMNGMLAAMEDSSGTIIIATAILAVALIVFAFLIGGEPDFPDGSVEAKEEARSRAAL